MTKRVLNTLYVFSFLLILLFGGCQTKNEPADIVTDFSANFNSSYRDAEYSGSISTNRQGVAYISISSPDELDGISFGYKNGELEMAMEMGQEAYEEMLNAPTQDEINAMLMLEIAELKAGGLNE